MFWIAWMAGSLPLPPNWKEVTHVKEAKEQVVTI